jgi:hypothetical protein
MGDETATYSSVKPYIAFRWLLRTNSIATPVQARLKSIGVTAAEGIRAAMRHIQPTYLKRYPVGAEPRHVRE